MAADDDRFIGDVPEWLQEDEPANVKPLRPKVKPSKADPFGGLVALPKVALFGRKRILELASTPIEYLWQDIAVAGTVVLIAGPPAEGKTTLLFLIIAARLNRDPSLPIKLLERELHRAPEGRFLVLIEGEHSEASTSRKLQKSLTIMGVKDDALERVIIVARKAVLVGSTEWLDVEAMIAAGLVSDVCIDTLARVAPADANDESQQVAVFNSLAKAIERAPDGPEKPTIWAIAHTRKNGTDSGLGEVSGSVQRVGQADTVLLVKGEKVDGQTVSSKVTFAKLREDPDEYPKPVEFSITKDEQGRPYIAGKRRPSEAVPLEERVLALLRIEARTVNWLAKSLGRSNADIEACIHNLFDAKAITTAWLEVKGVKRKHFIAKTEARGQKRQTNTPDPDGSPDEPEFVWDKL